MVTAQARQQDHLPLLHIPANGLPVCLPILMVEFEDTAICSLPLFHIPANGLPVSHDDHHRVTATNRRCRVGQPLPPKSAAT
jgi:hypothetical protein